MLVLSRKRDQSIVIDGRIVVRVVAIRGDVVRLGVEAPREISVHRGEVQAAIDRTPKAVDGDPDAGDREGGGR